ncbi:MAG: glycosyltransferase [bacterium]|nr:glycosyltransferase [bacterium]
MHGNVKISLVTTCKGRLDYLKESLLTWLAIDYDNFDIVVVDYDCPDRTENFITRNRERLLKNSRASGIHVVKVNNRPVFNLCDARNTGIDFADSELIVMIDADVHTADKNILNFIHRRYSDGVVFFSNTAVLSTGFSEGHTFYKAKYGIRRLRFHALLPTHCKTVGLSGTACFLKSIYRACGKYRVEVNRSGWGSHDIEFYIRYLNHFFYSVVREKQVETTDPMCYADGVLKRIDCFPIHSLELVENTLEEKSRFYDNPKHVSLQTNKMFITRLMETEGERLGWIKRKEDEAVISIFKYNRYKKYPMPPWFKSWYYYWIGLNYFNAGQLEQSRRFFENVIKIEGAEDNHRWQAYLFIARIRKQRKQKGWRRFLQDGLEQVEILEIKRDIEKYYLGSFLKFFNYYSRAEKTFTQLISETDDNILCSGACFHLGEMARERKDFQGAKAMFQKTLVLNPLHKKAAEYLKQGEGEK